MLCFLSLFFLKFLKDEKALNFKEEKILKGEEIKNVDFKENEDIIVESPKPNEFVSSPLVIKGKAKGNWFFEANFPVILTDWDGKIIKEYYVEAESDWMTNEFVPFRAIFEFQSPVFEGADDEHFSRRGYLIFKKANPSSLKEDNDFLEIPIKFK